MFVHVYCEKNSHYFMTSLQIIYFNRNFCFSSTWNSSPWQPKSKALKLMARRRQDGCNTVKKALFSCHLIHSRSTCLIWQILPWMPFLMQPPRALSLHPELKKGCMLAECVNHNHMESMDLTQVTTFYFFFFSKTSHAISTDLYLG